MLGWQHAHVYKTDGNLILMAIWEGTWRLGLQLKEQSEANHGQQDCSPSRRLQRPGARTTIYCTTRDMPGEESNGKGMMNEATFKNLV